MVNSRHKRGGKQRRHRRVPLSVIFGTKSSKRKRIKKWKKLKKHQKTKRRRTGRRTRRRTRRRMRGGG